MTTPSTPQRTKVLPRALRILALSLAWLVLAIWLSWSAGALWFDLPQSWPSGVLACAYLLAGIAAIALLRRRRRILTVAGMCAAVNAGWLLQSPANDRDWQPNVAVTAHAEIVGDTVTIHDIRDTEYRSEGDYTPHYRTRTVQLSKLTGADMFLCYWGSPWLAHPIVSFQFADAPPVAISVETRMEQGEAYTTLGGLYRRYELFYNVVEERDLVLLRTEHRVGEDVFLFRLEVTPERARAVFLDYLRTLNELHADARFYNVLSNNCTTNIRMHSTATDRNPRPWDWRILLPGKLDELIAMRDGFRSDLPLAELKPRSLVDDAANAAGRVDDFSRRIREGRPGF